MLKDDIDWAICNQAGDIVACSVSPTSVIGELINVCTLGGRSERYICEQVDAKTGEPVYNPVTFLGYNLQKAGG